VSPNPCKIASTRFYCQIKFHTSGFKTHYLILSTPAESVFNVSLCTRNCEQFLSPKLITFVTIKKARGLYLFVPGADAEVWSPLILQSVSRKKSVPLM
jgi:hypothetical protein